jgi:probable HAF family extracellular repeat protein
MNSRCIPLQLLAIVVTAICRPAFATPLYRYTDLGTLGGPSSYAFGINSKGQIAGEAQASNQVYLATLWSGGTTTNLGIANVNNTSRAWAINNLGEVAGQSDNATYGLANACVWVNGQLSFLGALPADYYHGAYGVNDSGQVTGYGPGHGAFFTSNGSTVGLPFGDAFAINNSGQVVGDKTIVNSTIHAVVWQNGTATDLGTLGGNYSSALAINNVGQIAGFSNLTNNGKSRAVVWANGTMTQLATLFGFENAKGINDLGQVVGLSEPASGPNHAVTWIGGSVYDLNNVLVSRPSGWTLEQATSINDSGWIVGDAVIANGNAHAFLLVPVPEPSSAFLIGIGGLAVGGAAVRRWRVHQLAKRPVEVGRLDLGGIATSRRNVAVMEAACPS